MTDRGPPQPILGGRRREGFAASRFARAWRLALSLAPHTNPPHSDDELLRSADARRSGAPRTLESRKRRGLIGFGGGARL